MGMDFHARVDRTGNAWYQVPSVQAGILASARHSVECSRLWKSSHEQDEAQDEITLIVPVPDVLTPEELATVREGLRDASFVDGSVSAGWSAREVKKNLQLADRDGHRARLEQIIRTAFLRNGMLQLAALPQAVTTPLFNRYDTGMTYGPHVDSPLMGNVGDQVRTDVAITIFLSDPESYDGGELKVHSNGVPYEFKLEAGSAIAYPANSLHLVAPVRRGARYAAILWVQSTIRDPAKRELLWDLETAKRDIFSREGKSQLFDAVSKSHANLIRMWAEP